MSSAAILVLEPDPEALALVEDELRRRYSADYEVVAVSSSDDGLRAVERLDREDRELALVLAGHGRDGADDRAGCSSPVGCTLRPSARC